MNTRGIIKKDIKILYPELSYSLNGIFFKIHRELERYCKEKQYADALERELEGKNLRYTREERAVKEDYFTGNITDFIVEDCVVIELKAKKFVTKEDFYQVKRYLISLNKKLGLLVNFRDDFIKTKRVLNNCS
jgi:GxxExxY protein